MNYPRGMISRTAEYAVRAMAALRESPGGRTGTATLSRTVGVPANYLSKILHALGRAGLVEATRGPGGGFRLSRPANRISAYEVVCLFDDVEGQRRCFLGNRTCNAANACGAHRSWSRVWDGYELFLKEMTLDRLTPPAETRKITRARRPVRCTRTRTTKSRGAG
ncbi:MAG: Rrf2 family transcriptional regulator [candidate division Zixibacteria bacterium]|nr:Rrf2 family transcriptional regulator [candidate division Zixibacteria bacterium]